MVHEKLVTVEALSGDRVHHSLALGTYGKHTSHESINTL